MGVPDFHPEWPGLCTHRAAITVRARHHSGPPSRNVGDIWRGLQRISHFVASDLAVPRRVFRQPDSQAHSSSERTNAWGTPNFCSRLDRNARSHIVGGGHRAAPNIRKWQSVCAAEHDYFSGLQRYLGHACAAGPDLTPAHSSTGARRRYSSASRGKKRPPRSCGSRASLPK